jgi:hypothetical protein
MIPEVTLGLALYDYLPMLVWIAGSYFLIDALRKNFKGVLFFYIFLCSLCLVFAGGLFKATWKLIIATTGNSFSILSDIQFPLMGAGFLLLFISLLSLLVQRKEIEGTQFIGAVFFKKVFLPLMVVGSIGSTLCLMVIAKKRGAVTSLIFYALFLVVSTAMGYIGSRVIAESYEVIFFEQTVNCFSTLLWAVGSYFLWRGSRNNDTSG